MTSPDHYQPPAPGRLEDMKPLLSDFLAAFDSRIVKFIQGMIQELIGVLAFIFTGNKEGGLPEITTAVTDQQDKLMQLLDERGRGHVFSSANLSYRGYQKRSERRMIPFNQQVGPLIGVDIDPKGGLIIKTPGSWEITAKVAVSGTGYTGDDWQRMWIEVTRANGSLLAESWATSFAGREQATMLDILPLVVNEQEAKDGVTVRVYQDSGRWRWLLGGHGYTLLKAQKFSSQRVMGGKNPTDPGVDSPEATAARPADQGGETT